MVNLLTNCATDKLLTNCAADALTVNCDDVCSAIAYTVTLTLDWGDTNNADLDAYLKLRTSVCYYGEFGHPIAGMTLNQDAHPVCDDVPTGAEIITGSFRGTKKFYAWYNQYSGCAAETSPSTAKVVVTNTGAATIFVNGDSVAVAASSADIPIKYAGYANGDQSAYAGGTEIEVTC